MKGNDDGHDTDRGDFSSAVRSICTGARRAECTFRGRSRDSGRRRRTIRGQLGCGRGRGTRGTVRPCEGVWARACRGGDSRRAAARICPRHLRHTWTARCADSLLERRRASRCRCASCRMHSGWRSKCSTLPVRPSWTTSQTQGRSTTTPSTCPSSSVTRWRTICSSSSCSPTLQATLREARPAPINC